MPETSCILTSFSCFLVGVRRLKESREGKKTEFVIRPGEETGRLKESLPYALTSAQERTFAGSIFQDLQKGCVMNRLVQGDVGSGKTVIAILALLAAAENGYQGALMVPTEVLARQHFESITKMFETSGIDQKSCPYHRFHDSQEKTDRLWKKLPPMRQILLSAPMR